MFQFDKKSPNNLHTVWLFSIAAVHIIAELLDSLKGVKLMSQSDRVIVALLYE